MADRSESVPMTLSDDDDLEIWHWDVGCPDGGGPPKERERTCCREGCPGSRRGSTEAGCFVIRRIRCSSTSADSRTIPAVGRIIFCIYVISKKSSAEMKKRSEETQPLRAGCSKAEPKIFAPPQNPFPGLRDGQNLISWRWSLRLPINPISSYRGNGPTNTQTNTPTNKPTNRQNRLRLQYTAPQLARSVIKTTLSYIP